MMRKRAHADTFDRKATLSTRFKILAPFELRQSLKMGKNSHSKLLEGIAKVAGSLVGTPRPGYTTNLSNNSPWVSAFESMGESWLHY